MHDSTYQPADTASVLLHVWQQGTQIHELPADVKPSTLKDGYDAQDRFFEAAGGSRAGWKLGVGSPAQMRAAKLLRPLIGQIDRQRIHEDGAAVRLPREGAVTVECEIAFVLDRDVLPSDGAEIQPEDIRSVCLTFELVRSRFVNRREVGWPSFAADNVGFEALVVSRPICGGFDPQVVRDVNNSVAVSLDGQERARALTGDDATEPWRSLTALHAHAAERGITLRAGDIVSTGAMCQPFDVTGSGHTILATYLDQQLSVRF